MRRTRFKGGGKRGQSYEEFFGFKRRKKGRFSLFGRKRKPKGCAGLVLLLLAGVAGLVLLAIRLGNQTESAGLRPQLVAESTQIAND